MTGEEPRCTAALLALLLLLLVAVVVEVVLLEPPLLVEGEREVEGDKRRAVASGRSGSFSTTAMEDR